MLLSHKRGVLVLVPSRGASQLCDHMLLEQSSICKTMLKLIALVASANALKTPASPARGPQAMAASAVAAPPIAQPGIVVDETVAAQEQVTAVGMSEQAERALPLRRKALREWLAFDGRVAGLGQVAELSPEGLVALQDIKAGDTIVAIRDETVLTAHAAYNDPDLLRLRAYREQAGPGFGVVALAGLLAVERVRSFRIRRMESCAPEAPGETAPSEWGAAARAFWSGERSSAAYVDPAVAPIVDQGVQILLPLLENAGRRAYMCSKPEEPRPKTVFEREPDHFARAEIHADGDPGAWSRGELARDAFALTMTAQRPPPPYLASSGANVADAGASAGEWTQRVGDETVAEPLALVPLLDDLLASSGDVNAVVGAPPAMVTGNRGAGQAVWCVAERDIAAGERISARDPW